MVLKCYSCNEEIKETTYFEGTCSEAILCQSCGENELTWNDDIEAYIYCEDDREFFMDDELSDIETFEQVDKNE